MHPWLDGFTCAYCELLVRTGDHRHPGYYRVIEHSRDSDAAELRVLHRFCARMSKTHDIPASRESRYGLALRRAWLGWATDQFLAGLPDKHYERLGLHPEKLRNPALFQKYWAVRKMRCASHALHYYIGRHPAYRQVSQPR